MKFFTYWLLFISLLLFVVACKKKVDCIYKPLYLNFTIIRKDSSSMISTVDTAYFNMYYLQGNNKINVKYYNDYGVLEPDFAMVLTNDAVVLSAEKSVKEFYFVYANHDVDTLYLDAEKDYCGNHEIKSVSFNNRTQSITHTNSGELYIFRKETP
jgi:hypothetical protein